MYKPRVSEEKDHLDLTNTNEALESEMKDHLDLTNTNEALESEMPSFANYISKKVAASRGKFQR